MPTARSSQPMAAPLLLAALFALQLPLAAQAFTLTADQATGGQPLTLADGRHAIHHLAKTPNSQSFQWTMPSALAPGWYDVTVTFAPFSSTKPSGNPRQSFIFNSTNRATVNFQSLGAAANPEEFHFQFYVTSPITTLEVRPNYVLPEPTRPVISVDIAPLAQPQSAGHLQLLDLQVDPSQSIKLPAGVGTGNWQIILRPTEQSAGINGKLAFLTGDTTLVSAPAGKEQFFYLTQAPDRVALQTSTTIAGATLVSFPAAPAIDPNLSTTLLPAVDSARTVTQTFTLVGTPSISPALPTLPLLPNGANTAVVTSWDDGPATDLRAAELLKKHGFGGTFFLTQKCWTRDHAKEIEQLGFEIASHSLTHPAAWQISPERWRYETLQMRRTLETDLGHAVISFAYPYNYRDAYDTQGEYVLRELRAAGYWSGRTTRTAAENISGYQEPLTLGTNGHFQQPIAKLDAAWQTATATPGGVFYFWGHTWENRSEQDWQHFDAMLAHFAHRPEAWYANQGQLFIWKWLTHNVKFTASASGEITLTRPWLDPYLAAQCPLTIKLPEGITAVRYNGKEISVQNGYATLQGE